jgi:hypothetical protein
MNKWKTVKKGDYLYAKIPDHPNSHSKGYVLEHRAVVEKKLGRYLLEEEVVHHIDENKHNNLIENLQVMSRADHTSLHFKTGRTFLTLVCPNCGQSFKRELRQLHKTNTPKCGRKCNGQYSRKIQLGLI